MVSRRARQTTDHMRLEPGAGNPKAAGQGPRGLRVSCVSFSAALRLDHSEPEVVVMLFAF